MYRHSLIYAVNMGVQKQNRGSKSSINRSYLVHCKCLQGFKGKVHSILVKMIGKHYSRETTIELWGKSLIVIGIIVNGIGDPHNPFRENFNNSCSFFHIKIIVFPHYSVFLLFQCSLKRFWGLPITFTNFPHNNS